MFKVILSLLTVFSLVLSSCGKKQAVLNNAIANIEKSGSAISEIVKTVESKALSENESKVELEKEKEKVRQIQKELEEAEKEAYRQKLIIISLSILVPVAVIGTVFGTTLFNRSRNCSRISELIVKLNQSRSIVYLLRGRVVTLETLLQLNNIQVPVNNIHIPANV